MLAYVFIPLIQKEMDVFRDTIWNSHRVRSQKGAQVPKGVPNHLYAFPENYDAEQSGFPVNKQLLDEVADLSKVTTVGDDFLSPAIRAECERIIPHIEEVQPRDGALSYIFLKSHFVVPS
ncbi:uncharacterized protein LOC110234305 [Exaiptasia diaphana]|uniref:Uncharacterized protein n=1 Tax=Exaiptasia diaphana TaxID=2652724 RepID=A0A913WWR7_EXADI|nr:uncharacterized protein LOC110234305 [Exaiptasia diaphana]